MDAAAVPQQTDSGHDHRNRYLASAPRLQEPTGRGWLAAVCVATDSGAEASKNRRTVRSFAQLIYSPSLFRSSLMPFEVAAPLPLQ